MIFYPKLDPRIPKDVDLYKTHLQSNPSLQVSKPHWCLLILKYKIQILNKKFKFHPHKNKINKIYLGFLSRPGNFFFWMLKILNSLEDLTHQPYSELK